jgi:tetratricopeptide (TPR) repeat protein
MKRRDIESQAGPGIKAQVRRRPSRSEVFVSIGRANNHLPEWEGRLAALDRFQAKVRLEAKKAGPAEGSNIWLQFGPGERESATVLGGIVMGAEPSGLITILLSQTTREFQSLKNLLSALSGGETTPTPPLRMPSKPSREPQVEAPVTLAPSRPRAEAPRPEPQVEAPVTPAPLPATASAPSEEPQLEVPVTPAPPRPEPAEVSLAQQAEALAARGEYVEAWRLYFQALQATPGDVALWYGLGITLSHLDQRKETAEAFRYVMRHGRPDSEEVRLARQWLLDAGALAESPALPRVVEPARDVREGRAAGKGKATASTSEPARAPVRPPRSRPPEPRPEPQAEARVAPVEPRPQPSTVSLAQQAEALAARGDYEGAWRLLSQAVQSAPDDIRLGYALRTAASDLYQRKEKETKKTDEAFPRVARPTASAPSREPQVEAPVAPASPRPAQPDSKEAKFGRRALLSAATLAELGVLTGVAAPVDDVREDRAAAKERATAPAPEPARAPVEPPRSKPPEPSPAQRAEARATRRDSERPSARSAPRQRGDVERSEARTLDRSMTKDERERALLALIEEGYKMVPSRPVLLAKVIEMRNKGDKEQSKASKKTRR